MIRIKVILRSSKAQFDNQVLEISSSIISIILKQKLAMLRVLKKKKKKYVTSRKC